MTKTKKNDDISKLINNRELVGKTLLLYAINSDGDTVPIHTVEVTKELQKNRIYATKAANGKHGTVNWCDLAKAEVYSGKPILDRFINVFDPSIFADANDVFPLIAKLEETLDIKHSLGPLPYDLLTRIINKEDNIWVTAYSSPVNKMFTSPDNIRLRRVIEGKFIKLAIIKGQLYVYIEADGKSKRVLLHSCVYNENKNEYIEGQASVDCTDGYDTTIDINDQVAAAYKGSLIVGKVVGINGNMVDVLPINITPDIPVISIYTSSTIVLEKFI